MLFSCSPIILVKINGFGYIKVFQRKLFKKEKIAMLIIRLIYDERSGVSDCEITYKSYNLLWLPMVGSIKNVGHNVFV